MLKRYLMVLTMLLALPAFANAWYVNAKTITTGQGTISPAGTTAYATGVESGEYTVTPAVGYKVSRVSLDGITAAPNGNGKYVAPYLANKNYRYFVAYFTTNTVNITTSATGSGAIREDTFQSLTNIPAGSARQVVILPNPGYEITAFDAADGTVTTDPPGFAPGSKLVSFTNLQANKTVSATFSLISVFNVSAGIDVSLNGPGAAYAANLNGSATSNQGAITYAWTGTGLTFGSPTAASTTVYGTSAGVKTATLSATSNGVTIIDTATVTVLDGKAFYLNQCTGCHSQNNPGLVADYTAGAHGTASGHTTGTCQRCHATDGAIVGASVGWTGGYASVLLPYTSTVWRDNKPLVSAAGVGCIVCHDSHNGLRPINTYNGTTAVAWDPNNNAKSNDQYDVCTSCHTVGDNSGALVGNYHDGGSINVTRTVSDSHFDDPLTGVGLATNVVEGYVIRTASANPCADCHNLHSANLTIQEAWAASAHAGKIAAKKEEAACTQSVIWFNATYPADPATACTESKTAGGSTRTVIEHFQRNAAGIAFYKTVGALDDAEGNAWTHYNWDQTSSRGSCQRCHTATGIANFLSSPATYNAAGTGNNFSHLSGWTASTGSPQQELLYCWGCHSDSQTGALRNPGALTEVYAAATAGAPAATVVYPDLGKSNVCMGCHLGREVGQNVANDTDADGVRSFINSHYLAAGATIFNESGYEYAGQSYNNFGSHKNVGVANAFNTGTAGPCVTCHMTSAEGHSFEVSAASTSCVNCHGGLTDPILEASKHEFHLALEELNQALLAKGIEFKPAHPYFYQIGTSTAFTNWASVYGLASWKDVMGAAFNYNLLEHDPGAYAHNRQYALKLIADSIDFLTDGVVDGQGVSAAFTAAAANKEFAEATSHPAGIVADPAPETSCDTCHSNTPHYGGTAFLEAQYVSDASLPISCSNCHDGESTPANQAILAQFAESAHGAPAGEAWRHYDWRSSNRSSCARCHTGTAFVAKLGNENDTTNVFLPGDVLKPGEALTCSACHTNAGTGDLRIAAQEFTINMRNGATVTYDVAGASTLCARCHSGRQTGDSIKADTDVIGVRGFVDSHYQPVAGILYNKAGYEYAGQSYDSLGSHKLLGATSQGPCVTCHMPYKDHSFVAASCGACHGVTAPVVNASNVKATYDAALNDLKLALQAKGIHYGQVHPFFFTAPYVPGIPNTPFTDWGSVYGAERWKDTMGAAFNYNLLWSEKGAFAHNNGYAMKLIADSIDFLSDGMVGGP